MVKKTLRPVSSSTSGREGNRPPEKQRVVAPTEKEYLESLVKGALTGQRLQIMTFLVDGHECAFEVSDAVEVLKPRPVTTIPRVPDFLLGILSVRGEMVPIIDLRKRLGVTAADELPLSRVLVVSLEGTRIGFIVDRMTGVEEVEKRSIRPPDAAESGGTLPVEFIKGVIELKSRRITLLKINSLVEFASVDCASGD